MEAVSDNVLPLTSSCNLSCVFCSHRQNPPGVRTYHFGPLSPAVLRQLIPFLDRTRKIIVGESSTRLCEGEPFTHPQIMELLAETRKLYPEAPLQITTNGTLIDEQAARRLSELAGGRPSAAPALELVFSLNIISTDTRSRIMGDNDAQKVFKSIELCRRYELPFHGSIVALPHLTGWQQLKETIFFLEEAGAVSTRLFLPGFTRFADPALRFDISLWEEIVTFKDNLEASLHRPLLLEPPLKKDLLARVEGVLPSSPARKAGLQKGDVIKKVEGREVCSGAEAFYRAKRSSSPLLEVERAPVGYPGKAARYCFSRSAAGEGDACAAAAADDIFLVRLDKEKDAAPGFIIYSDLDGGFLEAVKAALKDIKNDAAPLLLTSRLAAPLWEWAQKRCFLPFEAAVSAVENRFFGASICCAGLLTVSDIKEHLHERLENSHLPGTVIVPPAPFDHRGYDLVGEHHDSLADDFPGVHFRFPCRANSPRW